MVAVRLGEWIPGSECVSSFCVWEHVYVLSLQVPVSPCVPVWARPHAA